MRTSEFEKVKKWFRGIKISVKVFGEKIDFYNDLIRISNKLQDSEKKIKLDTDYYLNQIDILKNKIRERDEILKQCFKLFDEDEKNIMTYKYIKGIGWDYISMYAFFSKSQAVRIHNKAIKKIINDNELRKKICEN